jgi:tetratricopeptide (TPR) repeat protein
MDMDGAIGYYLCSDATCEVTAMRHGFIPTALISAFLLLGSAAAGAQSMTVIGGDSYARNCYTAATFAATMNSASSEDMQTCSNAIQYGSLSQRDLLATLVNRGVVAVALEDYQQAVSDYERAVKLDPTTGEVYVNRGNLFFMGQAFDKAVAEYSTALELGLGKEHIAYYNRGLAYEKMKDTENATADYRRASELAPEWTRPQEKLEKLKSGPAPTSGR